LAIDELEKLVNTSATLVGVVHEEGLEVEKIEAGFWEAV
jgi:hypothetical protein